MASKELLELAKSNNASDDLLQALVEHNEIIVHQNAVQINALMNICEYKDDQRNGDIKYRNYRYSKDVEHSKLSKKTLFFSALGVFVALAGAVAYLVEAQSKYNWIGKITLWAGI